MKVDLGEDFVFDLKKDEQNISLAERIAQAVFSDLVTQLGQLQREISELRLAAAIAENVKPAVQGSDSRLN